MHFKKIKPYKINGSVSIFISLILVLLLTTIFIVFDSARSVSQKTVLADISDISSKSLAGSYCYELQNDYGIFAINTSDINTEDALKKYTATNLLKLGMLSTSLKSVSISNVTYLNDNDGILFSQQIISLMKYMEVKNIKDMISRDLNLKNNLASIDVYDVTNTKSDMFNSLSTNSNSLYQLSDEDVEDDSGLRFFDLLKEKVRILLNDNLMITLFEDTSSLSNKTIDKAVLPSMTTSFSAKETAIYEEYIEDPNPSISSERIWFTEYISMFFSNYLQPSKDGGLSYEIEYIINGAETDHKNLYSTMIKLIALRSSFNASHILSSSEKLNALKNLAQTLSANTPVAYTFIETTLLSIWSICESIIDVKDLVHGKKVQIIKDDSHWTLSLDNILTLNNSTLSVNDGKYGFSYDYYLKLLLTAQKELTLRFRTLDLIQTNICNKYNNTFRISNCICSYDAAFIYNCNYLFIDNIPLSGFVLPSEFCFNTHYTYSK